MTTANDKIILSRVQEQLQFLYSTLMEIGFPVGEPPIIKDDFISVADEEELGPLVEIIGEGPDDANGFPETCWINVNARYESGIPYSQVVEMGSSAIGSIIFGYGPNDEVTYQLKYDAKHQGWYLELDIDDYDSGTYYTGACTRLCYMYSNPADAENINDPASCHPGDTDPEPILSVYSDLITEPVQLLFRDCFGHALTPDEVKRVCKVLYQEFQSRKLELEKLASE